MVLDSALRWGVANRTDQGFVFRGSLGGAQIAFSTRCGGYSQGPFRELNLGAHLGDTSEAVLANRQLLQEVAGSPCVFLEQNHSTRIYDLDDRQASMSSVIRADAAITASSRRTCTVLVADCLAVLLVAEGGRVLGAVHAGWKGLLGGVLEKTLARLRQQAARHYRGGSGQVYAWLSPSIGSTCFDVGPEVVQAFVYKSPRYAPFFVACSPDRWRADLPGLARQHLIQSGVDSRAITGNDGSLNWCTVSNPNIFFSYRRDGVTGRMAACIWREDL
jgi:YfiH family protein